MNHKGGREGREKEKIKMNKGGGNEGRRKRKREEMSEVR